MSFADSVSASRPLRLIALAKPDAFNALIVPFSAIAAANGLNDELAKMLVTLCMISPKRVSGLSEPYCVIASCHVMRGKGV